MMWASVDMRGTQGAAVSRESSGKLGCHRILCEAVSMQDRVKTRRERGSGKSQGLGGCHFPVENSGVSKNSNLEPGLLGSYEGIFS
jgi:hypothetical protein